MNNNRKPPTQRRQSVTIRGRKLENGGEGVPGNKGAELSIASQRIMKGAKLDPESVNLGERVAGTVNISIEERGHEDNEKGSGLDDGTIRETKGLESYRIDLGQSEIGCFENSQDLVDQQLSNLGLGSENTEIEENYYYIKTKSKVSLCCIAVEEAQISERVKGPVSSRCDFDNTKLSPKEMNQIMSRVKFFIFRMMLIENGLSLKKRVLKTIYSKK